MITHPVPGVNQDITGTPFTTPPPPTLKPITGPVELFPNGQCMAFHQGEQVGPLQVCWATLWAEHAVSQGYDPEGMVFSTSTGRQWKIIRCPDRWSFQAV